MHAATRNIEFLRKKLSIIIPCAGLGYRMKTYGAKCLIKINDETIIDRQVRLFKRYFSEYEIILTTGFQDQRVRKNIPSQVKTVYNPYYADTNVLHSIDLALQQVTTDKVIIIYGDLVFNGPILKFDRSLSSIIVNDYMKDKEVGCIFNESNLEQVFYNLSNKWAQILYLTGKELEMFKQVASNPENHIKFGFEAINEVVDSGGQFRVQIPQRAKVYDIDFYKDIAIAEGIR